MMTASPANDGDVSTWITVTTRPWSVSTNGFGSTWTVMADGPPPVPPPPEDWQAGVFLACLGWWVHQVGDPTADFAEAVSDTPRERKPATRAAAANRLMPLRTPTCPVLR